MSRPALYAFGEGFPRRAAGSREDEEKGCVQGGGLCRNRGTDKRGRNNDTLFRGGITQSKEKRVPVNWRKKAQREEDQHHPVEERKTSNAALEQVTTSWAKEGGGRGMKGYERR